MKTQFLNGMFHITHPTSCLIEERRILLGVFMTDRAARANDKPVGNHNEPMRRMRSNNGPRSDFALLFFGGPRPGIESVCL